MAQAPDEFRIRGAQRWENSTPAGRLPLAVCPELLGHLCLQTYRESLAVNKLTVTPPQVTVEPQAIAACLRGLGRAAQPPSLKVWIV